MLPYVSIAQHLKQVEKIGTLLMYRRAVTLRPRNYLNTLMLARNALPRHACPLKGPLLMQVQRRPQAAPGLVLVGRTGAGKRMQNHAPFGCMA